MKTVKKNQFNCVEMKHKIQEELFNLYGNKSLTDYVVAIRSNLGKPSKLKIRPH